MIKKISTIICMLTIFQVFLLVSATFAYPYLINQAEHPNSNASVSKDINTITKKAIILLGGILSIKQIGIVSAWSWENQTNYDSPDYSTVKSGSLAMGCCLELKNGAICEDLVTTDTENCKDKVLQTECSQVSPCKLGCCIDTIGGTCTTKAPKGKCVAEGGKWDAEVNCKTTDCQKGCCVLGSSAQFLNEKTCEKLSLLYGFKKEFKDLDFEIQCLALVETQETGACVYGKGECSFTTKKACLEVGTFYKDYLCSNPSLETSCTKQANISCVDEKDEIYWMDSCGNRENIYDADKDASWNNGKVLTKAQSCNPGLSNINSTTCGNCNRILSSVCSNSSTKKVQNGDFTCKSLECADSYGNKRLNGESWCVYDSYIGDGKDTVGSEHWRAFCNNGEVETDMCGDYRGRICVQTVMEAGDKNFSIAACVPNTAYECVMYNSEKETMADNCKANEYCLIKNQNFGEFFSFDFCAPRYPKGFNTKDISLSSTNQGLCATANVECSVVYVTDINGKPQCEENCDCEKPIFAEKMNDLCISLGDCGSYVNFKGKGTDNIKITSTGDKIPSISWKEYLKYATVVKGQYAKSKDLNASLYLLLGTNPKLKDGETWQEKAIDLTGKISGGLGTVATGLAWLAPATVTTYVWGETTTIIGAGPLFEGISSTVPTLVSSTQAPSALATTLGAVAGAAAGAALGAMLGSYLASSQGITGTPALIMTIAGAVAGAIVGYYMATTVGGMMAGLAAIPLAGWIIIAVMIVIMAVISLIGWGKTETKTVSFKCMPWEAPLGGDDCTKCNEDPTKPCTEYRCGSLGQACVLLNPESETPKCESVAKETIAPIISPGEPSPGYEFKEITKNGLSVIGNNTECITEFTPVSFTLKTNEYAQCVYSYTLPSSKVFEDMGELNYPKEANAFTINHTFGIFMPSISSLSVYDVTGDLKEKFGKMSMYVRCRDYWGNYNIDEYIANFCVNSGPDLTAVSHLYTTTNPKTETTLKYGANTTNVIFYINEPAECKYSTSSEKNYDEMENSMSCETDVRRVTDFGWRCNTTMTTDKEENKIYVKCKDQPWLAGTINETNRNINQEDYEYVLYVSKTELNITSTFPTGTIENGFEPVSIDLGIKTSGGAEDGIATCYWGEHLDIPFWETGFSNNHKQTLSTVVDGEYSIAVKCEDIAGNIATSEINFVMNLDTSPPIVVRTYKEGEGLVALTDEESECSYTLDSCDFDINNASSMDSSFSIAHRAPWEQGKTYYIKCKDSWGNANPWCAIRIQPE